MLVLRRSRHRHTQPSTRNPRVPRGRAYARSYVYDAPLKYSPRSRGNVREAKVHPDCEVQVDRNFYSVPHTLIGKSVRVKLGANTVEIFDASLGRVTGHARRRGIGHHSRYDWHYPAERLQLARYEVRHAHEAADLIGPQTRAVIDVLFQGAGPLRGLRRAQGVLRCARTFGHDALEHACGKALIFRKYRVDFIKDCAAAYRHGEAQFEAAQAPIRDDATLYLHSEYTRTIQ